jgi:hypothetical protein
MRRTRESPMSSFSKHMLEAQKLAGRKEHGEALAHVLEAEALLRRSKEPRIDDRAYVYDFKRFNLWELGREEEARAVCREAIDDLGAQSDWPFLDWLKPVRHTLRASYKMLAVHAAETAQSAEEIEHAVDLIDRCFYSASPIDDAPFEHHFESRALIYRRAAELDGATYREGYWHVLRDLADSGVAIADPELIADLRSPDYLAFAAANPRDADGEDDPYGT